VADISDVTAYLAQVAANAVYPNDTSQPSVAGMDCRIYEGWPDPDQLDLDVGGRMLQGNPPTAVTRPGGPVANVSIFPMQGTGITVYQILDETYTIVHPTIDLSITVSGDTVTVSGEPAAGEYLTLVCDDAHVYSQTGATAAALLSALASAAQANYPTASATATTLTVPVGHTLVVRQGGVGTLGKVTHRQRHPVMVSVWAPTQVVRARLASAIDNAIKTKIKVTMPDSSQALVIYNRTNVIDDQTAATVYRRDLIYNVEYATVEEFTGYVVTSTNVSVAHHHNSSVIPAIT
jgi:hypothetical protein